MPSAVQIQRLPGHVLRAGAHQSDDGRANVFLGAAMAPHGVEPGHGIRLLLVAAVERLVGWTPTRWQYRVYSDAIGSPFIGQGSGQAANGLLGGIVGNPIPAAEGAVDGCK